MTQKVQYDLVTRKTKDTEGVQNVFNRVFDKATDETQSRDQIGQLRQAKGAPFTAFVMNADADDGMTEIGSDYTTRSQAGHAILRQVLHGSTDKRVKKEAPAPADTDGPSADVADAEADTKSVTRTEAAVILGVSKSTIGRRIASGDLLKDGDTANVLVPA